MLKGCTEIFRLSRRYLRQSCYCLKNDNASLFVFLVYFPQWIVKNIRNKGTMHDRKPWLVFRARRMLNKITFKGMRVFEYGSGGSTLFFLDKGCMVSSVEHDPLWYNKISSMFMSSNWTGFLKEPSFVDFEMLPQKPRKIKYYDQETEIDPSLYISNMTRYWNRNFKDYVSSIDIFPDEYFDLILIDGRSRFSCWRHCRNKIKEGGFVILDNSERRNYQTIKKEIRKLGWKEYRFFGPGPYEIEYWETIIWKKCDTGNEECTV